MEAKIEKINIKKDLVSELIQLVEDIRGDLNASSNARGLREFSYSGNDELIDVTINKDVAVPGSYQLEVVQLAQKSSAMSSGFADKDDSYIGVGFIKYTLPNGDSHEIYVDSEHSSLTGIAELINTDESNGMSVKVINDGSGSETPWRLIISLDGTGDSKLAEFPYFYFVDGEQDLYLDQERKAHDAKIKLDGFEIEYPTNKINDLIPGVTLDLLKAAPGEEFTLTIGEDTEAITEKVNTLVDRINAVLTFIIKQNQMDETTDTSKTLGGDMSLQSLESRLRNVVFKDVKTSEGLKRLGSLGVTFQRSGLLKFEVEKFKSITKENYKIVSEVLRGHITQEGIKVDGFMDHLEVLVGNVLRRPNGLLQSRRSTFQSNIDQIDRRIVDKQRLIDRKEQNLKEKFARLEATISKLKSSAAGLSGLSQGSADPVTQLG